MKQPTSRGERLTRACEGRSDAEKLRAIADSIELYNQNTAARLLREIAARVETRHHSTGFATSDSDFDKD